MKNKKVIQKFKKALKIKKKTIFWGFEKEKRAGQSFATQKPSKYIILNTLKLLFEVKLHK